MVRRRLVTYASSRSQVPLPPLRPPPACLAVRIHTPTRYYDGSKGVFLSEDPTFWSNQNLADPQSLNSYSYGNDNPINRSDPTGQAATLTTLTPSLHRQRKSTTKVAKAAFRLITLTPAVQHASSSKDYSGLSAEHSCGFTLMVGRCL